MRKFELFCFFKVGSVNSEFQNEHLSNCLSIQFLEEREKTEN